MNKKILSNFNGDELASNVFVNKYALKNKNDEVTEFSLLDIYNRMFGAIKIIDNTDFTPLINNFLPAGRVLYALGNPYDLTATFSNCYVEDIRADCIEEIFNTAKRQARIFSKGGGVGFDISTLRPKGSKVNNSAGTTTGPTSFMDLYSSVTGIIGQHGRRGALMLTMDINHPDIIDFINIKGGKDKTKVQYANISIRINNDFMEAVEEDSDWKMTFTTHSNEVIERVEKAKLIWDLIVESNYNGAEPGLLYWDSIIDNDPSSIFKETKPVSTNPCFTGDTIVAVADGRNGVSIKELSDKDEKFNVYSARKSGSKNQWKVEIKPAVAFKTGERKIITLKLSDASIIKCTPEHLLALPDGKSYVEAKSTLGLELEKFYTFSNKNTEKSYRHIKSKINGYSKQYRMIWEEKKGKYDGKIYNLDHVDNDSTNDNIDNLELISIVEHILRTKRHSKDNPIQRIKGTEYLSLYSSRSNIQANGKRYDWSEEKINEKLKEWDNENLERLNELKEIKESNNVYLDERIFVTEIIDNNEYEDVYDLTVKDNHNFYIITKSDDCNFLNSSGVLVHNCGEQPLEPGSACNLGSINLSNFIINSFTENAAFDYDKFKKVVKLSIRFLDNVNILNYDRQPLEKNKVALKLGNRIGLGATGLADMLIKMNMKYDTDEAIEFTKSIKKILKQYSIEESIDLAEERGQCGVLDLYKDKNELTNWRAHEYWRSVDDEYRDKLYKFGIRNIGLNTIAPNGSLGIILRGTSGIEPIFALSYNRTVKQAGKEKDYEVFHPLVEEYNSIFGKNAHLKNENFIVSKDIDWKKRVKMQAAIQESISQSISSTVNLPGDTTKEVISNIYMEAWKQGLKGITIYRDGSRDGVLKEVDEKRKDSSVLEDVKFAPVQDAIMNAIHSEGRKWYVFYTINDETKMPSSLFVNTNSTETNIMTDNVLEYLEVLAQKYLKDILLDELKDKHKKQNNVTKIARTLSLLLRHNIPMLEIIKTIEEIQPPVYSFIFQIKKLLSKFVEGEYTGEKCSECDNQLVFEGGCSICMNCGFTACN